MNSAELLERLGGLASHYAAECLLCGHAQAYDLHDTAMLEEMCRTELCFRGATKSAISRASTLSRRAYQFLAETLSTRHWMGDLLIDIAGDTTATKTVLDGFATNTETEPTRLPVPRSAQAARQPLSSFRTEVRAALRDADHQLEIHGEHRGMVGRSPLGKSIGRNAAISGNSKWTSTNRTVPRCPQAGSAVH